MTWWMAPLIALAIHEAAHGLAALILGVPIRFKLDGWRPVFSILANRSWKTRVVCWAGFAAEIAACWFLPSPYSLVVFLHCLAYPWLAGDSPYNDLKGMTA